MKRKKKLKELTSKDNFMFGAVMMEEDNCKKFLELALGFPIDWVDVSKEKSIVYHPEYKGVRLDVYAKDEKNTRYNVEMQVTKKSELGKRVRYYHGQIDMELLLSGSDYTELPDVYVIFICDFDPFGGKKYRYTFTRRCEEDFVKKLQESIRRIKGSREMEERFMIFEEMLREERAEGRVEGKAEDVLEFLEDLGEIPEYVRERIMNEKNLQTLTRWLRLAAKADSFQEFLNKW